MARDLRARVLATSGGAIAATLAVAALTSAAPPKKPPPDAVAPDAAGPNTQLKSIPRLARVHFDVSPGGAVVIHDLVFPKGALAVAGPASGGDGSIFVGYTAQARPMAVEATRHALDDKGALVEAGATKLTILDVYVKPTSAALVLGAGKTAGHVIRLPRGEAPFALRIRTAISVENLGGAKQISLLARLGVRDGAAIPLDRIEVTGILGTTVRGAKANLCGPSADATPLMVEFPGFPATPTDAGAVPAATVTRLASDDLCIDVLI